MRSIVLFLAATQIAGAAEYLFSPRITPVSVESDTRPTFILKEEDKKKIPEKYWSLKGEDELFQFRDWLLKTNPKDELTIKVMRRELYSQEDLMLWQRIQKRLSEEKTPNQALQTTNRTVTEYAPSYIFRASAVRV